MATTSDTIKNILDQVAKTAIHINTHTTGHFISSAQLKALQAVHGFDNTPNESEDDQLELELGDKLAKLLKQREKLERGLRLEVDSVKRTDLNHQLGQVNSQIAKLKKVSGY